MNRQLLEAPFSHVFVGKVQQTRTYWMVYGNLGCWYK